MHANERGGVEQSLERAERYADDVDGVAGVEPRAVVGGLDPVDVADPYHLHALRGPHREAGEMVRGRQDGRERGLQPAELRALELCGERGVGVRFHEIVERVDAKRVERSEERRVGKESRSRWSP